MKDRSCGWDRDLNSDLATIRKWGAEAVVTLVEPHELRLLQVASMPEVVAQHGMRWVHLPISDFSVPDQKFEIKWVTVGAELRGVILRGGSILIHCRAGLGRAGMIVARLLVELGTDVQTAIDEVRSARPGAIVTLEQERHIRSCGQRKSRGGVTARPLGRFPQGDDWTNEGRAFCDGRGK